MSLIILYGLHVEMDILDKLGQLTYINKVNFTCFFLRFLMRLPENFKLYMWLHLLFALYFCLHWYTLFF